MGKSKKKERNTTKNKEQENLLKKLNRAELLELLIEQTKRADQLEAELEKVKAELANQKLTINNAGTMAQAAMELNKVFEAADKAAQQYVENVKSMSGGIQKAVPQSPPQPAPIKKTVPVQQPKTAPQPVPSINIDDWFKPQPQKKTESSPVKKAGMKTGMQLGEFLQIALQEESEAAKPAKSSIPFKSTIASAPAKKEPVKKAQSTYVDPNGPIDVMKILGGK